MLVYVNVYDKNSFSQLETRSFVDEKKSQEKWSVRCRLFIYCLETSLELILLVLQACK